MHKPVELSDYITAVHLATEYPKDIAATIGYDQVKYRSGKILVHYSISTANLMAK